MKCEQCCVSERQRELTCLSTVHWVISSGRVREFAPQHTMALSQQTTFTCFCACGVKETLRMKPFENKWRDTMLYCRSTLQTRYQTQYGLFTMPECPVAKADFFVVMEINPKQINFPQAPHPGSQLLWISNVIACSKMKVTMWRLGQIRGVQFKATSSSLRWSFSHLEHIYSFHKLDGDTYWRTFFSLTNGQESDRNQRSDSLPVTSSLVCHLTSSHSTTPPVLAPK